MHHDKDLRLNRTVEQVILSSRSILDLEVRNSSKNDRLIHLIRILHGIFPNIKSIVFEEIKTSTLID